MADNHRGPDYNIATPNEYGDGDSKKVFWTNVGVGFKTKDGKGINIILNALPVNGKLFVQKYVPKQKPAQSQAAEGLI